MGVIRKAVPPRQSPGLCRVAALLLAAVVAWWPGDAATQDADQWRILLLFSNESMMPASEAIASGFRETIDANIRERRLLFAEYLDADRFPDPEHEARMAAFLSEKYRTTRIDLAVALGPQALAFLASNRPALFPDVPIVFVGINESSRPQWASLPNATGVVSQFDPVKTVELALQLQPRATRVVVVTGASTFDRQWEAVARDKLAPFQDRLVVTYLARRPLAETLSQVGQLPPDTIVLFLTFLEDGAGEKFISREVAERVAAAASTPVYSVYDTYLGRGIVGGYVSTFGAMGAEAARIGLRILAGEAPESIPPSAAAATSFTVDWRQLRRWGLSEAGLPPDTVVRFKETSFWDRYRRQALVAIAVVLVQSVLIVGLWLQVRRRRRAETSLRNSEERYRDVVETQAELICRYLPDGTLTFVNDAYCRYFGRTRESLVGRTFLELLPEDSHAGALEYVASLSKTSRAETYEHQVMRPDGSIGWQQWTDRAVRDAYGRIVEFQGVGRDITELKRAEAEAKERREQVTHLTRVGILGELSSALAHELNQPLTAILSNAQAAQRILVREPVDLAEVREILSDIVAADTRAGEVIRRLRALLQRGEARRQPLDINEVVAETLELARSEVIARHIAVATSMTPGLPRISGDRVQLQQVLLNLIVNACEAMNGTLPSERSLSLSTAMDGDGSAMIAVADRGHGLSPEVAARLFEPFYTTKAVGLGLGLSISRSIIAAHGGRLWAANNPEGGSTFYAVLPGIGGQTG